MFGQNLKTEYASDLTKSQLSIWTGQQLSPCVPLYNMVFTFDLAGEINVEHFQNAFQILVDRSDSMRTVFYIENDIPQRKVIAKFPYEVEFLDWSNKQKSSESKFEEWMAERMKRNFDLSKSLFDSVLIKLSETRFVWYLNQHHLITDGWSVSTQYKAFAEIYELLKKGEPLDGFQIPQFQKYLEYEKNNRQKLKGTPLEGYWKKKLDSISNTPKLYGKTDEENTTASNRISIDLGKERSDKLRQLASEKDLRLLSSQLTLFNIFATILNAYLYRISGEQKIVIGTPSHNRITKDFKNTLGLFIEMFPLLTEVDKNDTFVSLFNRLKNETNGFLKNAQSGASDSNLNKSFNVILNYITAGFSDFNGIECNAKWIHSGHHDSHHHLRLEVYDFSDKGDFKIDFDINNSVIPEAKQNEAIEHFLKLLDAFLDDRTKATNDVEILGEVEKERVLDFGNGKKEIAEENKSIMDLLDKSVENFCDKTAVCFEDKSITYKELDEKSNQLANHLIKLGVKEESRIGLFLERSTDLIVGIFGILKAGGAYVPLDSMYPKERLKFILEDAAISIIVSQKCLEEKLPENDCKIVNLNSDSDLISNEPKIVPNVQIDDTNLAYVIYTSGSTGKPKGAMNEHSGVVHLVEKLSKHIYFRYENSLNIALIAPCVFDASMQQIFAALLQGHTLHIAPECARFDGNELAKFYGDFEIDISDGTPAHLRLLLQARQTSRIPKHFIIGGEAMSSALVNDFQDKFKSSDFVISNVYGVAECCVDSIVYDVSKGDILKDSFVPIGKPLNNERVYILNKANQLQPIGTHGEIAIGGESVGRGYLNLAEISKAKFIENPFVPAEKLFKTGDLGYFLPNGNIQYIGRKDNQVNVNGYRIELGEIENILLSFKKTRPILQFPIHSKPAKRRCKKCLITESHPNVTFDLKGVCKICNDFDLVKDRALDFFKKRSDFETLISEARQNKTGEYDCLLLYSGGKDSSYVLYKLVEMGLKVLAFTFDNGFISKAAFENIKRQTSKLGVDCVIEKTDGMDEIFVESLNTDKTVCSGCFKSLTAISTKLAQEKGINVVITGLSRGQIFDTKLAGLFEEKVYETDQIEEKLLLFRKMFHAADDRTNQILDIDLSDVEFEQIHFLDFFRYDNTPIAEIKEYLEKHDTYWQKPEDTGFCSSNCLMNDIGICVHSSEAGFHNYEAPLSWDVRLGISSREEVLPEVESKPDEKRVNRVLEKIGFYTKRIKDAVVVARKDEKGNESLCAYFVANQKLTVDQLRNHLAKYLPDYMIPTHFIQLEKFSLTNNGKIDKNLLPLPDANRPTLETEFVAPDSDIEEIVAEVWSEILQIEKIGAFDNFLNLGGNSLDAIRVMTRLNDKLELEMPLNLVFEKPTVSQLSGNIEKTIMKMLEALDVQTG